MATLSNSASMSSGRRPGRLTSGIQNPTTLLAAYDLFASSHPHRGLRRDPHVAAGADIVLECNNRRVALTRKEPVEAVEQILIDFALEVVPFLLQLFQPAAQCRHFPIQIGNLLGD